MAEKMKWTQEQIEKLIYFVKQYDCIYNVRSAKYLDRVAKAQAFNTICDNMKMQGLDVAEVKKKWKCLRTQFLKEMREVRASKKSGSGVCDVYVPKLWCFSQLQFLEAHTHIRRGQSNIEDAISPPESEAETYLNEEASTSSQAYLQSHKASTSRPQSNLNEVIDITADMTRKEPQNKRGKENQLCRLRKDLSCIKNKIIEKRNKPFAWLGNLVAAQMEEIIPEQRDDAAWEVQCLMRRLVQKSKNCLNETTESVPCHMLQTAMNGVFDETDFE